MRWRLFATTALCLLGCAPALTLELTPANPGKARRAVDRWRARSGQGRDPHDSVEVFVFEKKKWVARQLRVHRSTKKMPVDILAGKQWCAGRPSLEASGAPARVASLALVTTSFIGTRSPCFRSMGRFDIDYPVAPDEDRLVSDVRQLVALVGASAAAIVIERQKGQCSAASGHLLRLTGHVLANPKYEL